MVVLGEIGVRKLKIWLPVLLGSPIRTAGDLVNVI